MLPIGIGALALLSLLAPFEPMYDPWAWLVWGRELAHLDLDTSAGPSWKPLPAIIDIAAAPTGGFAPQLWLAVARAGWLAAVALAWALAARLVFPDRLSSGLARWFAPRRVRRAQILAGATAALGVVLLYDPFTAWTRQFAGGLSEPLLVALVLGAIERELAARRGQALALAAAAALLRPEAWPFLALYGFWLWRSDPSLRRWLVVAALAVPLLWLIPDLAGSGDPLTGAERARGGDEGPLIEGLDALWRSFNLVLAGLWVCAGWATYTAWRERERRIVVLAVGALAWVAVVVVLALAGYAGLPRFAAPAGAIVCVLGGVGLVRMIAAVDGLRASDPRRRRALAAAAAVAAALVLQGAVRAADVPGVLDDAAAYGDHVDGLAELVEELGPQRARSCRAATTTDFLTQTALAWELDVPLSGVALRVETAPPSGTAFVDAGAPLPARAAVRAEGDELARHSGWSAYAISCAASASAGIGPSGSAAAGLAIAGVVGARR